MFRKIFPAEKVIKKSSKSFFWFFFAALFFLGSPAQAQRSEIGVMFGGSYYLGDLNPTRQFAMTRIAGGGLYRHNFTEHLSLRVNGFLGSVEASDAIIGYNETRNLSFRSTIVELSVQGEVNFLPFEPGNLETVYTPYFFAGIGGFSFNPKARNSDGEWVELQPLGTEGQGTEEHPDREPYNLFSYSALFGVGVKFNITRSLTGGLEWGLRRTGTDYLDDVSTTYPASGALTGEDARYFSDRSLVNRGENAGFQRGNPTTNDWYSFAGFILTFKMPELMRTKCPAYN